MRTVWASVLSVWALFGVVAYLAWTRPQPSPAPSVGNVPGAVIVKDKNGKRRLVVISGSAGTAATHATTRTSPVPAG